MGLHNYILAKRDCYAILISLLPSSHVMYYNKSKCKHCIQFTTDELNCKCI